LIFSKSFRVLPLLLGVIAWPALAINTSAEEKTCREIGFKPKTEKYANCVLELYERRGAGSLTSNDTSPDDQACRKYGYKRGTSGYADCLRQIDMARQEHEQRQREYQAQLARYEEEKRAHEEAVAAERRRRMGAAMMQYGLGLASGMRPEEASAYAQGLPVPQRPRIHPDLEHKRSRIVLPNGNVMNCNHVGSNINCF